jgi:hypothetical protein
MKFPDASRQPGIARRRFAPSAGMAANGAGSMLSESRQ